MVVLVHLTVEVMHPGHGGSATSRPVKTGDPMNPVFWGLVLLVSVIVIAGGVVVYKKRKQK